MVDLKSVSEAIGTNKYERIEVVPGIFSINTVEKTMTIVGHKINNSTYIINKAGKGDITLLGYKCDTQNIVTGLEYLCHMCKTGLKD